MPLTSAGRAAARAGPIVCLGLAALAGCSGLQAPTVRQTADRLGLEYRVVAGERYRHEVYARRLPPVSTGELHVYLEGDGTPWLGPNRPAPDPTPRNPVGLRLMAMDPGAAIFLGRPCYGQAELRRGCRPWDWTHGRYSQEVVASLAAAIDGLSGDPSRTEIVLVGYSGGGALAMLLAARLPRVSAVITLAGNLDIDRWAAHHGYSPLTGSLDPADLPPLPAGIRHWHWVGGRDENVPPAVVESGLVNQPSARVSVIPNVDHDCCWERLWPGLLEEVVSSR